MKIEIKGTYEEVIALINETPEQFYSQVLDLSQIKTREPYARCERLYIATRCSDKVKLVDAK